MTQSSLKEFEIFTKSIKLFNHKYCLLFYFCPKIKVFIPVLCYNFFVRKRDIYMKKQNILNLIKYHIEDNDNSFVNEAINIAKYFDKAGGYLRLLNA